MKNKRPISLRVYLKSYAYELLTGTTALEGGGRCNVSHLCNSPEHVLLVPYPSGCRGTCVLSRRMMREGG